MESTVRNEPEKRSAGGGAAPMEADTGMEMRPEDIKRFLEEWKYRGCARETLLRYRHILEQFYGALPADKRVRRGTLVKWQEELTAAGYSASTIRTILSVCNTWLDFMGHREYQKADRLDAQDKLQPELSRNEYLRMLSTAKNLGDEKVYLLVKIFACTGLNVRDLPQITVENVKAGRFFLRDQETAVRIPEILRRELLSYAERSGIGDGSLLLSRDRRPLHRSVVSRMIQNLSVAARIPPEKGNPRCLRKLYQTTQAQIALGMELLIEQAMDRQFEREQTIVGWEK